MTTRIRLPSTVNRPRGAKSGLSAKAREILERWAPQICTAESSCPRCKAKPGERCRTDRPLHLERWDAWMAARRPT